MNFSNIIHPFQIILLLLFLFNTINMGIQGQNQVLYLSNEIGILDLLTILRQLAAAGA